MQDGKHNRSKTRVARMLTWTIRHQDQLAFHTRLYMWSAVAIVLLLCLAGEIPLEAALEVILIGGLMICGWLWILIEWRRAWLLGIDDPDLKQEVYACMLAYLAARKDNLKQSQSRSAKNQA